MFPYQRFMNPGSHRRKGKGKGKGKRKSSSNSQGSKGWVCSDEVMEQMIAAQQRTDDQPSASVVKDEPPCEDIVKEEQDMFKEDPAPELYLVCIQPDPPSTNDPGRQEFVKGFKYWLKANFTPEELHSMFT